MGVCGSSGSELARSRKGRGRGVRDTWCMQVVKGAGVPAGFKPGATLELPVSNSLHFNYECRCSYTTSTT